MMTTEFPAGWNYRAQRNRKSEMYRFARRATKVGLYCLSFLCGLFSDFSVCLCATVDAVDLN